MVDQWSPCGAKVRPPISQTGSPLAELVRWISRRFAVRPGTRKSRHYREGYKNVLSGLAVVQ